MGDKGGKKDKEKNKQQQLTMGWSPGVRQTVKTLLTVR